MNNKNKTFIWSDGWWVEGSEAWFICGVSNMLFHMDFKTGKCEEIVHIPDPGECTYRLTPHCLKCGRDIFCIPGAGRNIWIYNLDDKLFSRMNIDKPDGFQMVSQFWIWEDAIFIISANWNKIIEVSISQKTIKNYYTICEGATVQKGVLVDCSIYMTSSKTGRIYQFDITAKKTKEIILPGVEKQLFDTCYDGEKFWFSGYQKEIYLWKGKTNKITIINPIPAKFNRKEGGDKRPAFKYSVAVGGCIWFIPIVTDQIIYVDKESIAVSVFEICDEEETEESIFLRKLWTIPRYLLEYTRDNRYIGLFSAKSGRVLEIDTERLDYQWKEYNLRDKYFFQRGGIYKKTYYEGVDEILYKMACCRGIQKAGVINDSQRNSVGTRIHQIMKGTDNRNE